MRTGGPELVRDLNRSLVLNLIRERGPLSRADVARESGLSPSTVTEIVAGLVRDGFVLEDRQDDGERPRRAGVLGRPATLLRVDPGAGRVVGIKVAAEAITLALTDLAAEPIANTTIPRASDLRPADIVELLADATATVAALGGIAVGDLLGVGIGVPGSVDPQSHRVSRSPMLRWGQFDVAGALSERLGLSVHIDNDVNTLTIAEQLFGAGRGHADVVVVTVGRGIGMGAVLDGTLFRGLRGGAGELGHVVVEADGPVCWCGRHGCLEAVASEPAIVRQILAATQRLLQPGEVAAAAMEDERIAAIAATAGARVGLAVANVITLFDPEVVIVSGEGVRLGQVFLASLRAAIEATHEDAALRPGVVVEPWGDEAWARGAAALVLRELFHPAHLRAGVTPASRAPDERVLRPAGAGPTSR